MSPRFDPDIISRAPTTPRGDAVEGDSDSTSELKQQLNELRRENIILQDDNTRLTAEISVESQKARLIIPYANKVFNFCCIYTVFAFSILFLDGYEVIKFSLDDSTLNFIAGSNLASVVGLVGIIAGGLFSSK